MRLVFSTDHEAPRPSEQIPARRAFANTKLPILCVKTTVFLITVCLLPPEEAPMAERQTEAAESASSQPRVSSSTWTNRWALQAVVAASKRPKYSGKVFESAVPGEDQEQNGSLGYRVQTRWLSWQTKQRCSERRRRGSNRISHRWICPCPLRRSSWGRARQLHGRIHSRPQWAWCGMFGRSLPTEPGLTRPSQRLRTVLPRSGAR